VANPDELKPKEEEAGGKTPLSNNCVTDFDTISFYSWLREGR
jgi:hypothetical protein